ncbi:family 43 glycosylhydrolase [Microbacterium sp. 22215]|uniref:family 43 glycosylhydrolase n=1 Tax=Microbacterium sp. 22215 TaxID=3453893 RepID=UPI003F84391D
MIELYRDPVYDGATDPRVVIDSGGLWWMFYTQRRASLEDAGPGVSWIHGSRIGVATSADGVEWTYDGTLEPAASGLVLETGPPPEDVDRTHWAPEVVWDGEQWRMYLTEIDGIPDRWPGFVREIVEYVSDDLRHWSRRGALALSSDRVIDAAVARTPDGLWRLWYKDEAADSVTMVASSADLGEWTLDGVAIGGRPHEGPTVFELGGFWWMIVDEWRGMGVYRSDDGIGWVRQGGEDAVILADLPGGGHGNHGAHVRDGDELWFYFFGTAHDAAVHAPTGEQRRAAVYRLGLEVEATNLVVKDWKPRR